MADAELEKTTATISISGNKDVFTATGEVIKFDGFLHVYRESYDDDNEQEDESRLLPPLKKASDWNTALSSQPNGSLNARHATRKQVLCANWKNWVSDVVYVRSDNFHYPTTRICRERKQRWGRTPVQRINPERKSD